MNLLLFAALVLLVGWIGLGTMLWWFSIRQARLAMRIKELEKDEE